MNRSRELTPQHQAEYDQLLHIREQLIPHLDRDLFANLDYTPKQTAYTQRIIELIHDGGVFVPHPRGSSLDFNNKRFSDRALYLSHKGPTFNLWAMSDEANRTSYPGNLMNLLRDNSVTVFSHSSYTVADLTLVDQHTQQLPDLVSQIVAPEFHSPLGLRSSNFGTNLTLKLGWNATHASHWTTDEHDEFYSRIQTPDNHRSELEPEHRLYRHTHRYIDQYGIWGLVANVHGLRQRVPQREYFTPRLNLSSTAI